MLFSLDAGDRLNNLKIIIVTGMTQMFLERVDKIEMRSDGRSMLLE